MTKSYFISDSILKRFLHILWFSVLFWWWMVSNFFRFYIPPGSRSEALHLGVQLFLLMIYPPEALQLGVHLILLYFIRIWILSAEIFSLFGRWRVEGGGWMVSDFFGLQFSLYWYGIYFRHRNIYIYKIYLCRTIFLWV